MYMTGVTATETTYPKISASGECKMNIYIGNLNWGTTESDLQVAFEEYGQVSSVTIIKDRYTGQSRGFGFVEMPSDDEGRAAIEGLNGKELDGRTLRIDTARPRDDSGDRESPRY
jgi:RNA recognition motif-containing protein